ncbi:MAG TPA: hypothetical protein VL974_07655 [Magnetospirillum sp.]|jgi:hypothetical protein|nr:hypothetical protein [Magnetospirillum sp.]
MRTWSILAALLALPLPAAAQGTVVCDAKVMRIVKNLRDEPMTPDQTERARQALYAAIEKCHSPSSSHYGASRQNLSQDNTPAAPSTQLERESWRAQQNVLSPAEQREGERRLDAIDRRAQTDPRAAQDMKRIWDADRSLNTINRPIPGGPSNPSLVGPGDRN